MLGLSTGEGRAQSTGVCFQVSGRQQGGLRHLEPGQLRQLCVCVCVCVCGIKGVVRKVRCTQIPGISKAVLEPDLEPYIMLSCSIICAPRFSMYRLLRKLMNNRQCHISFRWTNSSQREHYLVICGTFCECRETSHAMLQLTTIASRGPHFMASPNVQSCHCSIPKG